MSQIYKSSASGPVPPAVPTSFVTDVNSPSVPIANVENVIGGSVTTDNPLGVQTDGSSGSNTLTIQLTNRFHGTGTTVGATTADLITFALGASPATYLFEFSTVAFNSATPAGAGYKTFACVRTTGASAIIIDDQDAIVNEEAALNATDDIVVISGNNAIFRVLGVAGLTIDWLTVGTYVRVT